MAISYQIIILALLIFSAPQANAWTTNEKLTCQYGNGSNSRQCLLCNCVFETIGESEKGKVAVANTVLVRMKSDMGEFNSDTACGIIYQANQYSWTKSKTTVRKMQDVLNLKDPNSQTKFQSCVRVVDAVLKYPPTKGPLWYHATYVRPSWAKKLHGAGQIGAHLFYTDPKDKQVAFDNMASLNRYLSGKRVSAASASTESKAKKAAQ